MLNVPLEYRFKLKPHPFDGDIIRIECKNGWGLSCINGKTFHSHPYAWEIAVTKDGLLNYDTALTSDVEVFDTEVEAQAFIDRAIPYLESL